MFNVVPMQKQHTDAVSLLSADASFWSENAFLQELTNPNAYTLIALSDTDEVIGFINAHFVYDDGAINNICVNQNARNQGVATAMLSATFETAKQKNISMLSLEVRISNQKAISFYQKYGFTLCGKRKGFYQNPVEDALIYTIGHTDF